MIPAAWRSGEVAVVGLGRSGRAAARYLAELGITVYASDIGETPALREAADALRNQVSAVDVGRHDLDRIARAVAVVASPGIPPDAPALRSARDAGVVVLAELDVGAMALERSRFIVVTGTNGKTTTTALTAHLLEHAGVRAAAAGNIGRPLIDIAREPTPPDWVVVEASSFQLHDAPHLRPDVGVVTNLSPDHLDRYPSVAAYYDDKRRLFQNATAESVWVLNGDEPQVLGLPGGARGMRRRFSLRNPDDAWYDRLHARLMLGASHRLIDRDRLKLLGDHNVANALAASLAAVDAGAEREIVAEGLASFESLPHRLQPVGEFDGVQWINDSKATNVASTVVAVRAMTRPFVLIAGGRPKGEAFGDLAAVLDTRCRGVVAYGEARQAIVGDLGDIPSVREVELFEDAVRAARELARPGDSVLLSPGAASFDQFRDYEARGETFTELAGRP